MPLPDAQRLMVQTYDQQHTNQYGICGDELTPYGNTQTFLQEVRNSKLYEQNHSNGLMGYNRNPVGWLWASTSEVR
jgi:hypothetical protein